MLLIAGPAPEFLGYIQILCWILLPILFSIAGLIVFFHYRKRRAEEKNNDGSDFMGSPELVGYTKGDGEYVLFDYSGVIREYKKRLSYNQARYTALQHDFAAMETKYVALARFAQTKLITDKKETMQNFQEQMPKGVEADINKLAAEHAAERKDWLAKLEQLERSYKRLEQENKLLQEQLSLGTATDDERMAIMNRWKEENTSLRDKIADHEYLEDLLEEKKAQLNFLQNQLEQRIKNLYQSEHQRLKAVAEAKQSREDFEKLKNELLLRQEQSDKAQVILCEKEEQLAEKERSLTNKIEQVAELENQLREAKEQNERLQSVEAGDHDKIGSMQRQLADEESKLQLLEQKFSANKQTLRKIYKELSVFVEQQDADGSPVIALKPGYANRGKEETAV